MSERIPRHGTPAEYTNHKCRCDECRDAWRVYMKRIRDERKASLETGVSRPARGRGRPPKDAPQHGLASTYRNWKCRCPACTEAHRISGAGKREKKRPKEIVIPEMPTSGVSEFPPPPVRKRSSRAKARMKQAKPITIKAPMRVAPPTLVISENGCEWCRE